MVIKRGDYAYLIHRYERLAPEAKEHFDKALVKAIGLNPDDHLTGTIRVVPEQAIDEQGASPDDRITRTLITKVFKEVTNRAT
jgi:hypothetical protein